MKRLLMLVVVSWTCACAATTYYVSSKTGNDGNAGTQATPWKTLASVSSGGVHAALIVPGTTVLLARGDVWQEPLVPGSSGASGSPIVFDAYGVGAAPEITGNLEIGAASWSSAGTNQWSAPVTATTLNYVLFGTIWGTKQTSQGAVQHERDFYFSGTILYVYAPSNPATYYGSMAAMLMSNLPLISVSGKQWLTFQHMKLDWFDAYGVSVTGASDHLVFANMEVDGMIPAGALPHGFYVNATPGATDIRFVNADAHMCYDGFRFDGTVGTPGASIVNARAYFNRNYGIDDTTGGQHVTYSYSHLYGNGVGVLPSTDVFGAVEAGGAGNGHNLPAYTAPAVNSFARYPARITYTIDDEGKSEDGADYIDSLLPQFAGRNLKLSIAVVAGGQYASGDVARIQGWFNAGHDINSHSWSHNYYDGAVINVKYRGAGTAATLTVAGNMLTTAVTGGPGGENLSFDLTNASYATFGQLAAAINGRSGYTASAPISGAGTSTTLASVSGADIKTPPNGYGLAVSGDAFVPDEMAKSKSWLLTNVNGLSSSELVYVYPSGKENYQAQLDAVAAGYKGGRGSLSMGQAIPGTFTVNSGPAPGESMVRSVYGTGVNIQNITSLGTTSFAGYPAGFGRMTSAQTRSIITALVAKAQAWGSPYGLFSHPPEPTAPELTVTEIGGVLDALVATGAIVMTNTQLVDFLASQKPVTGSTFYVSAGTSATLDLGEAAGTATALTGANQGAAYATDLSGVTRLSGGTWDIGAYQIRAGAHGGRTGTGHFTMGGPEAATAWFSSPTDSNVDQISAPAQLIGLNGINNSFTGVTGNKIVRVTEYSMGGGSAPSSSFRANSDSNDNIWFSDDKIIAICRTGGGLYLVAWDPVGLTATPKGTTGGNGACDASSVAHATPATYFGNNGGNGINGGSVINKYTINTASPTWTGSVGGNSSMAAAITATRLLDISTDCPGLVYNKYAFPSNVYNLDGADRFLSFGTRVAQDNGSQHFVYDSTKGCWWVDLRTMTSGGSWGPGSLTNPSFYLLPTPAAPTLMQTTGGTLVNGHVYKVCVTYTKSTVGETPCSATSSVTMSGGNNAISVAPPTATPAGTISVPTGFNPYACDNTASPGCTPKLQSNGTNASGALSQVVVNSETCTSNCTNNGVTYTYWVAANNAGGQGPLSQGRTTAAASNNAIFTVNVNQDANATSYTIWLDFKFNIALNANAGSCGGGTCNLTLNTSSNAVGFRSGQVQTAPIATTPVVTSVITTSDVAPVQNSTGFTYHDIKNDGTIWLTTNPLGGVGSSYSTNPRFFIDWSNGTLVFASNTSNSLLNAGKMAIGHQVTAFGKFMGNDSNGGLFPLVYTLNDNSATAENSGYHLTNFITHSTDVHWSAQLKSVNPSAPWWFGADGSGYQSHAVPVDPWADYLRAIADEPLVNSTWKFCQQWQSGMSGFNTFISGNPSPDGKFILFSTDMGIGNGVTSGQLGGSSGAAACTDGVDCRTDAFVCVTR